jgi:GMP synthase-like glutamine amidotransferase
MTVTLSEAARADPVFDGLPSEPLTLQWHGDTFDLPDGAVLLAGSAAYPHQAFRLGRAAYGVQFHLEVSREMAAAWAEVPAYSVALDRVLGPGALEGLLAQMEGTADGMRSHGRAMFERWLDLIPHRGSGEPSRGRR